MTNQPASLPVLLMEDDSDLAANIVDFLEIKGWLVDYAPNGALALHKVLSERFCAAVLDINVPGIDGIDLCQRIRSSSSSNLPILMLTAADQIERRLSSFGAGADDYTSSNNY
ncbi:MAG: response regulator [Opitutales bacterium]